MCLSCRPLAVSSKAQEHRLVQGSAARPGRSSGRSRAGSLGFPSRRWPTGRKECAAIGSERRFASSTCTQWHGMGSHACTRRAVLRTEGFAHCRFDREAHQQQCLVLLVHRWRLRRGVRPRRGASAAQEIFSESRSYCKGAVHGASGDRKKDGFRGAARAAFRCLSTRNRQCCTRRSPRSLGRALTVDDHV